MRDISGDDGQPMLKRGDRDEEIGLREGMPLLCDLLRPASAYRGGRGEQIG